MPDFRAAAEEYFVRGWLSIPLMLNEDGFPKKPMTLDWPNLPNTAHTLSLLPWQNAAGIGLVLGSVSDNLGAVDVDDQEFAVAVSEWMNANQPSRYHWTQRRRLHVLCRQPTAVPSRFLKVRWQGRDFGIELKSTGNQIAVPPTSVYEAAGGDEPWEISLAEAWARIAMALGATYAEGHTNGGAKAGYPKPWLESVPEGERNKALYVEACRLRDARMPLGEALEILRVRLGQAYEGIVAWGPASRTIQSAYNKKRFTGGFTI